MSTPDLMALDNHLKNVFFGVVSLLVIFLLVQWRGVVVETGHWLVTILLLLIYFEIWDLVDKKR
jgi:hypothetical protein